MKTSLAPKPPKAPVAVNAPKPPDRADRSLIPVTIELPAQAYDLIAAMAPDEGCKEVADCVLSLLITAAAGWCDKYKDQDELEDLFRPSRKEAV